MSASSVEVRQERDRVSRGVIHAAALALALILTAGWALTWVIERHTPVHVGLRNEGQGTQVPREINMIDQTLFSAHLPSRGDWDEKRKALHSYEWADGDHQTVRIPIDRAMQLIVERGHVE